MEVKPGSTWMHYSGNVYTVIEVTETGFIKYKSASGHVLACSLRHFRKNFIEVDNKEPE